MKIIKYINHVVINEPFPLVQSSLWLLGDSVIKGHGDHHDNIREAVRCLMMLQMAYLDAEEITPWPNCQCPPDPKTAELNECPTCERQLINESDVVIRCKAGKLQINLPVEYFWSNVHWWPESSTEASQADTDIARPVNPQLNEGAAR